MSAVVDRVRQIQLEAIPERLGKGAFFLGRLWRGWDLETGRVKVDPIRCSKGWSAFCDCPEPNQFCSGKLKWLGLLKEYATIDQDLQEIFKLLSPASDAALLYAMRVCEFEATLMTIYVKPPVEVEGLKPLPFGTALRFSSSITARTSWPTFYKKGELDERFRENRVDKIRLYRLLNMTEGFLPEAWRGVQDFLELINRA